MAQQPLGQSTYAAGDRVHYQRWVGTVYEVQSDGGLLIDFTLNPAPIPFFRGPYWPHEVTRV